MGDLTGVLVQKQVSNVDSTANTGRVNMHLSKAFLSNFVESDLEEDENLENVPKNDTTNEATEKRTKSKENEVIVKTKETSDSRRVQMKKLSEEEKNVFKFLTKSMEFTSSY